MPSRLITVVLCAWLVACGSTTPGDAGVDAGRMDSGTPDSGTPDSGTPDSGMPDSGMPDSGMPDAGCGCGSRVCLADGGCGDCARDQDCTGALPVCDTTTNVCVRCRATPDSCDAGSWCNGGSCAPGCGRGSDCASGQCNANHECERCRADAECLPGRLCTSGACHDPCSGTNNTCGPNRTCCGTRCALVGSDPKYCSGCGGACAAAQVCSMSTCADPVLSGVCFMPSAIAVLDGFDDAAAVALAASLSSCSPAVPYTSVSQLDAGFINPETGYPSPTGATLCVAGGSFFQRIVGYLEQANQAPVRDTSTPSVYRYSRRDGGVIAQGPVSLLSATRDVFVVQIVHTPEGVRVLNAAGYYAEGTTAAAWYFVNTLLPMRPSLTDAWYVVDWTDLNVNGMPDPGDTWVVLGQGVD